MTARLWLCDFFVRRAAFVSVWRMGGLTVFPQRQNRQIVKRCKDR